MKFLSWMKSKIHGKDNTIKPEPASPSHDAGKEETRGGCSSTLLSIGTFGNINPKDDSESEEDEDSIKELELRGLLSEHGDVESERFDLPTEKLLESLRSNDSDEEMVALHNNENDIPSCSRRRSMYRKSISFLLKKAFICGGGFMPTPIIRQPFPNPNLDTSRMQKILKTVIRKKKHPKYLDKSRNENEEEQSNANNWVKTDSEYIFLNLREP